MNSNDSGIAFKIQKMNSSDKENLSAKDEALNVAKKILSKQNSTAPPPPQQQQLQEATTATPVRSLREKFESKGESRASTNSDAQTMLTPRLLIQKFEALSRDNSASSTTAGNHQVMASCGKSMAKKVSTGGETFKSEAVVVPKVKVTERMIEIQPGKGDCESDSDESDDDDDEDDDDSDDEGEEVMDRDVTLTPRRIREKFEQMQRRQSGEDGVARKFSNGTQHSSLTFVSSMPDCSEAAHDNSSYEQHGASSAIYEGYDDDEPIYEELTLTATTDEMARKQQIIRNFKIIDEDEIEDDEDDYESEDTYSVSSQSCVTNATNDTYSMASSSSFNNTSEADGILTSTVSMDEVADDCSSAIFSIKDYRRQKQSAKASAGLGNGDTVPQKSTRKSLLPKPSSRLNIIDEKNNGQKKSNASTQERIKVN